MSMRLLLVTGDEQLNNHLKGLPGVEDAQECLYREAALEALRQQSFDVVVFSAYMPGTAGVVDVALEARYHGARVVCILEAAAREDEELLARLISCGVYDLLFVPVAYEAVARAVLSPASFKDAARLLPRRFWRDLRCRTAGEAARDAAPQSEEPEEKKGIVAQVLGHAERLRSLLPVGRAALGGYGRPVGETAAPAENTEDVRPAGADRTRVCGPVVQREPGSPAVFPGEALPYEAAPASAEPAVQPDVYALGIEISLPGVAAYATREELFSALAARKPRALVLPADYPGALDLVRELRSVSRLADVAIGVVGAPDGAFFAAGADECFEALDGQALARLLVRRERLIALWQEANTDGLTGLFTRRFLDGYFREEFSFYAGRGVPLSLVLLDLDHFKKINDAHGHSAGDEVLRRLGDFLRRNLRERDAAFRYGGEEIVLVLPGTDLEEAAKIAERLRRGWEALDVYGSTFSAGVAQAGAHGQTPEELLSAADRALYAAKRAGRNRVAAAGEEPAGEGFVYESAPARRAGKDRPVSARQGQARLVAVASCSVRGAGVSTVAAALAKALAAKGRVAAVDCDAGGLGVRLGLEPHAAAAYDWRKAELPVYAGDVAVYPLDPAGRGGPDEDALGRVLAQARAEAGFVVLDLGAEPDAGLVAIADTVLWVVRSDPVALERVVSHWPERPIARCREAAVLFGGGDSRRVEELLVVPCFALRRPDDRKGLAALVKFALSSEARRGVRVLVVGFQRVPDIEGVTWDPVPTVKAARAWLARHRPEMAVVRVGLAGGDLVEYDLRKAGVPVYRLSDLREIKDALGA